MATFGDLNGSGNQQIWLDLKYISSDIPNNRTRWYAELRYYGNGWGSWGNSGTWSVGGFIPAVSGSWSIPSGDAYDTYTVLWSGYFYKTHNSSGVLAAGNGTGSINYSSHSSISSGSVSGASGAPPRLATGAAARVACAAASSAVGASVGEVVSKP